MMNVSHLIRIAKSTQQAEDHVSFMGGKPRIPSSEGLPQCRLCGAEQAFLFQVAFPQGHCWQNLSLATFSCISCVDENHLIPRMLPGELSGINIPAGFLLDYQVNFRFLVFRTESAEILREYDEKVVFSPWGLMPIEDSSVSVNKGGWEPRWLLGDEGPGMYSSSVGMVFLMQIDQGFKFPIHEDAPSQVELGLDGRPKPSPLRYYQLFLGNAVFLFGTADEKDPLVYAITQVD